MDPLSQEQEDLLLWIQDQPGPTSMHQMSQLQAPNFSRQRVGALKKAALLDWTFIVEDGNLVAGYSVSDKGLALLQEKKQLREQAAKQEAARIDDRKHDFALAIIGAVVGSGLTLVCEHFGEIVTFFRVLIG
ncbi:MAG: hypothetical protein KHZ05_10680 [Oscillospiraceae bacterium]|nr:hypothetical protein [Oscillospiraceae bacterium]